MYDIDPQPFPLPPMCKLSESELIYPGERLILISLDETKLSGALVNYDPKKLSVTIQAEKLRAPIEIRLNELKMMSLPTARRYILDDAAKKGGQGEVVLHSKPQEFEVIFEDGDSLSGETFGFRFDQNGIGQS